MREFVGYTTHDDKNKKEPPVLSEPENTVGFLNANLLACCNIFLRMCILIQLSHWGHFLPRLRFN